MNHNDYDINNFKYRTKINEFHNKNFLYSNDIQSRYKMNSLLNMNKAFNDNTSKNLNLEVFKNFNKQNENEQPEVFGNKKYSFNEMKNNIYGYSHFLTDRNLNNKRPEFNLNQKKRSFFNDYYNEEIKYMNMKIDLRVIEHKLNCLLNIYSPNEIYTPKRNKSNYENNNSDNSENNINNENNYDNENKYSPISKLNYILPIFNP